jgi:hypothetical protein
MIWSNIILSTFYLHFVVNVHKSGVLNEFGKAVGHKKTI